MDKILSNLIGKRFKTIEEIEETLSTDKCKASIVETDNEPLLDLYLDGTFESKNGEYVYQGFTLYYIEDRQGNYYITEVTHYCTEDFIVYYIENN